MTERGVVWGRGGRRDQRVRVSSTNRPASVKLRPLTRVRQPTEINGFQSAGERTEAVRHPGWTAAAAAAAQEVIMASVNLPT